MTAYFPGSAGISLTAAKSGDLITSEFFISCLLDQINVKRQFLINWRFLMKTKNAAHFRRRVKSILF